MDLIEAMTTIEVNYLHTNTHIGNQDLLEVKVHSNRGRKDQSSTNVCIVSKRLPQLKFQPLEQSFA